MPVDIFALHEKMTAGLFPAFSNEDERFLALALCGEAGELANMVKKRWRDKADLTEEIRDEIADIRVYLELIAKRFGIEGSKLDERVASKLEKVVEKFKARLTDMPGLDAAYAVFGSDGYYVGHEDAELCEKLYTEATKLFTMAEAETLLELAQKKWPNKTLEIVNI